MDRRQFTLAATAATAGVLTRATRSIASILPLVDASTPHVDSRNLDPGQFEWQPDLSPEGALVFIVSLPDQLVHIYRNGIKIGVSTCSTGRSGHRTPTGVFVVLEKDRYHRSSIYNNAPMPNMQRLTWRGVALHGGYLPGYPASHGCIRLPKPFAKIIFEITHLGIPVIIADSRSQPEVVVNPGLLLPERAHSQAAHAMTDAARNLDPSDVMSAVVSGADKKAIVLVDGEVTWESAVDIVDPGRPLGDHAFTLLGPAPEGGTYRWLVHDYDGNREVIGTHDAVLSRIKAPRLERMLATAKGTPTLVVTDKPADAHTRTRPDFVIADAMV